MPNLPVPDANRWRAVRFTPPHPRTRLDAPPLDPPRTPASIEPALREALERLAASVRGAAATAEDPWFVEQLEDLERQVKASQHQLVEAGDQLVAVLEALFGRGNGKRSIDETVRAVDRLTATAAAMRRLQDHCLEVARQRQG